MAKAQVITQNNINEVVDSLSQNEAAAAAVVPKLLDTIKTIANKVKDVDKNAAVINKVHRAVKNYNNLMTAIVSSLCSEVTGGKTLAEIMGRIETQDEYDPTKKVVKYTTLDAAQQIPKLLDTSFKMLQTVGDFKSGFAATIKMKKNIRLFKSTIKSVLAGFMDMFSDVVNHKDVDNILKKLVKQPDTVSEHIQHGYDYDAKGVKRVISDDIKKDNKGGEPGILDIVDKTFSIVGLMNNMKLPSFLQFYANIFKLKIQLKSVIGIIISVFDDLQKEHGGEVFNKLNLIARILVGDGEDAEGNAKGEAIGLFQVAMKLKMIIDNLSELDLKPKKVKRIVEFFKSFSHIIGSMLGSIKSKAFIFLGLRDTLQRVSSTENTVNKYISMINTFKESFGSILFVYTFKEIIVGAITTLIDIINAINKSFESAEIKNSKVFDEIQNSVNTITEILNNINENKKAYGKSKRGIKLLSKAVSKLGDFISVVNEQLLSKNAIDNNALSVISDSVTKLIEVVMTLSNNFKEIKKSVKPALIGMESTKIFLTAINVFVKDINSFEVKELTFNVALFEPVAELVKKIKDCAKDFALMSIILLPAIIGMVATVIFAWLLVKFVHSVRKIFNEEVAMQLNIKAIDKIKDVIDNLSSIAKAVIITALLTPIAIIGLIALIIFTGILIGFVVIICKITEIIDKVEKNLVDNFASIFLVITIMFAICAAFVLLAALAPLIIKVITDNIGPLLMVLLGAVVAIGVFSLIGWAITKVAKDKAITFALNMILILGVLMMTAIVMLIVVKISEQLTWDAFGKILAVILGMIVVAGVMVGLGIALTAVSPYIAVTIGMLWHLAVIFVALLAIGGMILAIGKLNFTFGEYDKSSENIKEGVIGSGTGAIGNVSKILAFVKFIRMHLNQTTKDERKSARQSKRMLKQVKRIVRQILNIGNQLLQLQDITINESKITENVGKIFAFVATLEQRIAVFLGAAETDEDGNVLEIDHDLVKGNARARKKEFRKSKKMLNKVDKVIIKLNDIGTALASIEKLEMTGKFETNILKNISNIFTFIGEIDTEINKFMKSENVSEEEILDASKMKNAEWRKNKKTLSKIEATILTMQNIGDALNTLKDLKLDDKEGKVKQTIIGNVTKALESIEEIGKIITGKSDAIQIKEKDIEKLTPLVDYIHKLNKGFEGIASSNPESVKSNIDNYIKFIDKVNTVDVTKLETSTKMFEQMSSFSSSIRGDFDKLAEALSEKLLPVLEELKEVMGVLPEKIDVGFQNTSKTIVASSGAQTKEAVTTQTKITNPGLTDAELEDKVKKTMNEQAKAEANGIGAKLDELMSLLKGMSGENVIVQTI